MKQSFSRAHPSLRDDRLESIRLLASTMIDRVIHICGFELRPTIRNLATAFPALWHTFASFMHTGLIRRILVLVVLVEGYFLTAECFQD